MIRLKNLICEADDFEFVKAWEFVNTLAPKNFAAVISQSSPILYRGMEKDDEYIIRDPKAYRAPRKAANTTNQINLLVSQVFQNWKQFPPRNQSYICSTDPDYAGVYGSVFVVIPEDLAPLGVCSESDFWHSFTGNVPVGIADINEVLTHTFKIKNTTSAAELVASLKAFDKRPNAKALVDKAEYFEGYEGNLYKTLEFMYDPIASDFSLIHSLQELSSDQFKQREVWTNGKCLMVNGDNWNQFLNSKPK